MRDLTERALDTAAARGAAYADVRVVRRRDESIAIKTGRVEGVASGESEGFGVRVLVDGAWGFASSHLLTTAEADRVAGRGGPDRPGERHRPAPADPPRRPPAGPRPLRDAARGGSVRGPARARRSRTCSPPTRWQPRVKGIAFTESSYAAQREWKTFAATDGSLTEQVITHVGAGRRGERRRRRRAPAPELPGLRRRLAGRRLRVHPGARPGRACRAAGRRGRRAADRPAVPVGPVHDHPRSVAALPPGPRVVRSSVRARSRVWDRGVVRRDELPDHRQARRRLPLRLGPDRHRRRRHGPRWDGHVRLGRRGRRRAGRAARPERHLRRLPDQPRDRATDRPAERRRDARRRLEPDPAHPDDQHQPAATGPG